VIPLTALPALNATLNGTSAVLLTIGFLAIRRRRVRLHRACMVAAFVTSIVFLASYITYHLQAGTTRFAGAGWVRPVYFTILGTHTFLAALIPPLAIVTLTLALRARFVRHARLARWTLPAWLYVSVTGVVIYAMLYWVWPGRAQPSPAEARRAVTTAAAQAATPNAADAASDGTSGGSPLAAGSRHARSAARP
jgi:putative membrane protein